MGVAVEREPVHGGAPIVPLRALRAEGPSARVSMRRPRSPPPAWASRRRVRQGANTAGSDSR